MIVIVLFLLSTTGIAGWLLTRPSQTYVTTLNDNGPGSLRYAINQALPKSTLTFDTSLRGTILLSSDDLIIAKNLTIRGPGAGMLSISSGRSGHEVSVVRGVTVTISDLTFKDSTVDSFIVNEGTLTLANSTVSGNTAAKSGGGISISGSGIRISPVQIMLLYCTVYGNTASTGGGIWIADYLTVPQDQASIGASIVAGNNASTDPDIGTPPTSLGYNLIGNRSGATLLSSPKGQSTDLLGVSLTNLKIDPRLRDNGGSAKPHTFTHALLLGSPAIDAIPLRYCQDFNSQSRIYTDQRGMKRPDENESACDIGAYEYVGAPT